MSQGFGIYERGAFLPDLAEHDVSGDDPAACA
jgi:hypothetical protein